MPNQHKYPNLNISGVSPELLWAVRLKAARDEGRTVSALVRRLLEQYVAERVLPVEPEDGPESAV